MDTKKALGTGRLLGALAALLLGAAGGLAKDPPAPVSKKPDLSKQFLPRVAAGKTWRLAWNDEFAGAKLDKSKWEICGDWKRRDGHWVKADAYLDGKGHLLLRTKKEADRFTSGAIRTRGKFEQRFGYWECRCKFPTRPGHWPAFWLFSDSVVKVGNEGRDGTEIDIAEMPWRTDHVQHALHWDGYGKRHKSKGKRAEVKGIRKGFHTFGLHWKTDEYVFYVDGKETWRTKAGGVSQVKAYVKLTEEIGKWGGDIKKARLPDHFTVDYVRVFEEVVAAPAGRTTSAPVGWSPRRVVYVIDRSGSMAVTFDEVRVEVLKSISRLKPEQEFHIILFAYNKPIEGPERKLLAATADNKLAAKRFLRRNTASGQTFALPALKRAFAVLGNAKGRARGGVIYLLTDGDFSGMAGGSPYVTKDGKKLRGNEAVIQFLRDYNPKGENQVHVHTFLYHSKDAAVVKVMKNIAKENGGRFKHIIETE